MLNEVVFEGVVAGRTWVYNHNQYFRLACYRDAHRPPKPQTENRDTPDYLTAMLVSSGLQTDLQPGMKVRVHGYIQSRQYRESLDEWLNNANGPTSAVTIGESLRNELNHNRVVTEIVIERIVLISRPTDKEGEAAQNGKKGRNRNKPNGNVRKPEPALVAAGSSDL